MQLLLREGMVGSDAFKAAVERQLVFFEEELGADLVQIASRQQRTGIYKPALVARADNPFGVHHGRHGSWICRWRSAPRRWKTWSVMVRMIVVGTQTIADGRVESTDLIPQLAAATLSRQGCQFLKAQASSMDFTISRTCGHFFRCDRLRRRCSSPVPPACWPARYQKCRYSPSVVKGDAEAVEIA
jgi:hypothetical protein